MPYTEVFAIDVVPLYWSHEQNRGAILLYFQSMSEPNLKHVDNQINDDQNGYRNAHKPCNQVFTHDVTPPFCAACPE